MHLLLMIREQSDNTCSSSGMCYPHTCVDNVQCIERECGIWTNIVNYKNDIFMQCIT